MSINLLDSLLSEPTKAAQPAIQQADIFVYISLEEWSWEAFNQYFDHNQLGKRRGKLDWKSQTAAYLKANGEGKITKP